MSTDRRSPLRASLEQARDLVLTVLTIGVAQVLVALLLWSLLFGAFPQGFAMALSLVGFGGWLLASLTSLGLRRQRPPAAASGQAGDPDRSHPVVQRMQAQVQRSGCGCLLLLSSLIPLGLAFVLRVQADLRAGLTWRDILPPLP